MNNGTQNDSWRKYQVIQEYSVCNAAIQAAPAGLSLPVPAHLVRSCSTRSWAMNFARSDALHAAQKPTFPAIHE
jgi:hypothetical protein